jgi:hypothetical protein
MWHANDVGILQPWVSLQKKDGYGQVMREPTQKEAAQEDGDDGRGFVPNLGVYAYSCEVYSPTGNVTATLPQGKSEWDPKIEGLGKPVETYELKEKAVKIDLELSDPAKFKKLYYQRKSVQILY